MISRSHPKTSEFGDFQTPAAVTQTICRLLAERGSAPASVIEPTCGIGNFLLSALNEFSSVKRALGIEINQTYADKVSAAVRARPDSNKVQIVRDSFFSIDVGKLLRDLPEPILAIGNPPWITNSQLSVLGSANVPTKANFQHYDGLAALTGKSNFDISEWILVRLLELLQGRRAELAMLCKTAVARKMLLHAWKNHINLAGSEIRAIDAPAVFGAAVDACLLFCSLVPSSSACDCQVFRQLEDRNPETSIGFHNGLLIADVAAFNQWRHLIGEEDVYKWRSGIKHDCAKVMELRKEGSRYRNGLEEVLDVEDDYVYPMLKSSELANGRIDGGNRWMVVIQRNVGDDTKIIRHLAPKTWKYLEEHSELLDGRVSSIYRNRPRFSVFGVGEYSFSPWKVAISGFYSNLHFAAIGDDGGKPMVFDDTCYFVACYNEEEAKFVASLLNAPVTREFFSAFIFWDAKRPVTTDVLQRLNLLALAREVGEGDRMSGHWEKRKSEASSGQREHSHRCELSDILIIR